MSNIAIRVENVGKRFELGELGNARDLVRRAKHYGKRLLGASRNGHGNAAKPWEHDDPNAYWALKDINFEVKHGEVLGIIGHNGAGKSTLLKVLSRITAPTTGRIDLYGRVASLLEVGTGFHPELTGRENIYLNGAILGMTKREVDGKLEEIIDFAGVEKFLDTPVKRYSSGMRVRLGFAVAAHLEPEILIIDEVLAVGDAGFQKKCLGKMRDVASSGRTVLFVSHQMGAVSSLTDRCLLISEGQITDDAAPDAAIAKYMSEVGGSQEKGDLPVERYRRSSQEGRDARFTRVWVRDSSACCPIVRMGSPLVLSFEIMVEHGIQDANVTVIFKDQMGRTISLAYSPDAEVSFQLDRGRHVVSLRIPKHQFTPGRIYADIGLNQSTQSRAYDVILNYPLFDVIEGSITNWTDRPWGAVHENGLGWQHDRVLDEVLAEVH